MKILIILMLSFFLVACHAGSCGDAYDCDPGEPSLTLEGNDLTLPIPVNFDSERMTFSVYAEGVYPDTITLEIHLDVDHGAPVKVETEEQLFQLIDVINEQLVIRGDGTREQYLFAWLRIDQDNTYRINFDDVGYGEDHIVEIRDVSQSAVHIGMSEDLEATYD